MSDRVRLFGASFLMLFVELVLIRWLTAHILYLSYFTNFVLLGSFLGIGIGFLSAHKGDWFSRAPLLLLGLVVLAARLPVTIDRSGSGLVFFGNETTKGLPIWLVLPFVFVATAATLASAGCSHASRRCRRIDSTSSAASGGSPRSPSCHWSEPNRSRGAG